MTRRRWPALLLPCLAALAACHPVPAATEPAPPKVEFSGFFADYRTCRAKYRAIDAKIDAAGVRNPTYYRVPGFPYLRTDRLLASYRNEVSDLQTVSGWVRHMRELDQEAREFEYVNLGLPSVEAANLRLELLACGRGLASLELDDPAVFRQVVEAAPPPEEHAAPSPVRAQAERLLAPLLQARLAERREQVLRRFADPLPAPTALRRWQPAQQGDFKLIPARLGDALPDELGLPGLFESAWVAIAEANAPTVLTMQGGLATPALDAAGEPRLDPARPQLDYHIGFARHQGRALIQMNYLIWPAATAGAAVDGLIWRVTLDEQFKPLVYDAIRASGLDHAWFPAQPLRVVAGAEPLLPQPGLAPAHAALVLDARGHLLRVLDADALPSALASQRYRLARYEDLYRLPRPGGGSRSLFGPDGVLRGHPASSLGLLSGLPGLGSPRHIAHLPAEPGQHGGFDDPHALDLFASAAAPGATSATTPAALPGVTPAGSGTSAP